MSRLRICLHVFLTLSDCMIFLMFSQGVGIAFLKSAESANLGKMLFSIIDEHSRDRARSGLKKYQKLALAAVKNTNRTLAVTLV